MRKAAQSGFARHVAIREEYDPSLPPVHGDRDLLLQVFLNLVKNAAEAVPEVGGEIVLTTAYRHGLRLAGPGGERPAHLPLMVSVADNGAGIPDDLKAHLFDPFVTTKRNGTGLGLALVAKVIGDHGGVIEFDSQPRRTVFRVFLPIVAPSGVIPAGVCKTVADDERDNSGGRRRSGDPHGAEPGAGPARPRCADDRQRGDPVAMGRRRRGRPRHHRCDHAGRERSRSDPAHQAAAPGSARHRHERAEHAADRGQGGRARRLRIPAEAVRPARTGQRRRAGAERAARARAVAGCRRTMPRSSCR